jgi:hypothetical protein
MHGVFCSLSSSSGIPVDSRFITHLPDSRFYGWRISIINIKQGGEVHENEKRKVKEEEMDAMDEEENGLHGRNGQEKEGEEEEMDAMDEEENGLDGRNGQEKDGRRRNGLNRRRGEWT